MRFGLPITLTTQTFYLPRRFELPGVNCIIIVVVIITNIIIINNYFYYYYITHPLGPRLVFISFIVLLKSEN